MSNEKIIKDIRYYESNWENKAGSSLPSDLGEIYTFTTSIDQVGQRIARKLHQYKFISGIYDHIYFNFTTLISHDEFNISERNVESWLKYVDCGLDPEKVNLLNNSDKERLIEQYTFKVLRVLYQNDNNKLNILDIVEDEVIKYGSKVEIIYKEKDTSAYNVVLSYMINPLGGKSCVVLKYLDKKNNKEFKDEVLELDSFDDIYSLVNTVTVKDGYIILQPKKSFRAEMYNTRYNVPLKIDIERYIK